MNSSAGSDLSLAKRPSRHVSIHIPSADEVVRPSDSVVARNRSAGSLNHAHSSNIPLSSSSTTGIRPNTAKAAGRRIENGKDFFSLPGESNRSQLKYSKLASSVPRLEKARRRSATVCDNSSLDKSSASAVDSSADDTVLSKASRKITSTVFSGSDINRTLTAEVRRGKMNKDLAKLVISLSMEGSEFLPLPKTKASELRSWILAPDSGCLKLPLSVQNHLNYVIQISDSERSTTKKSRNLKTSNVGFNRNIQVTSSQFSDVSNNGGGISNLLIGKEKKKSKLSHARGKQFQADSCCSASRKLGKSGRNNLKDRPVSSHSRSFLTNKTGKQEFNDDVRQCASRKRSGSVINSRSFITGSVVSDQDENVFQPLTSHRKSADRPVLKHLSRETSTAHRRSLALSRNLEQVSAFNERDRKSVTKQKSSLSSTDVKNSQSFEEEAQSVIKKINRTLQMRRMLRNSSYLKTQKSPTLRSSNSKDRRMSDNKLCSANTGLKQHKLQCSASSSTTEDDSATSNDISKLLYDQNFSVRSHSLKIPQQEAGKSFGSDLHVSAPNQSRSITRKISNSSFRSRGSFTRRHIASKKALSVCASRKASSDRHSSARMQDAATFSLSEVHDSLTAISAANQSLSGNSSKTQKNLTYGKVCQSANIITSAGSSRYVKPTASVPPNSSNKKVAASCKEVSGSNKSSPRPSAQLSRSSKLSGRWSDLGSWNGKVYTIKRVQSSSKTPTPKSVNNKQPKKKSKLPLKSVGSDNKNKRTSNKKFCEPASDKSSVETVISCVTSKPSLNSNGHTTTSVSPVDKPSPRFKVHSTTDRSDSKFGLLKRHVKKPSVSDEESVSKSGILSSSTKSEGKTLQKRTLKAPKSIASPSVKSEAQSSPSVLSEMAASDVDKENCSTAGKRSQKPDADKPQISGLSDTESAVSNSTFVAENSWHFGVPPQSWLGSWSLNAANGSRSSLDTETDKEEDDEDAHSDDTLSVGADGRCTCGLGKVASFDRAVSTDSEPELSSTMLQTEAHEKDREEANSHHHSELAETVNASSPSMSQNHCASSNDEHFERSLVADRDAIFNSDSEDIHLEPFPSCLFSLSSIDVAADLPASYDDYESTPDDELRASVNSSTVCVLDNSLKSAENEVTAVSSVNENAETIGTAEDWKVLHENCEINKPGCEVSTSDSGNHLNDNVNNFVCSSSNSSPLSSDEQESDSREQSSKCTDDVRVCSSKSLTGRIHHSVISDSSSSSALSRSNRFRSTHKPNSLAACADSQHGMSLPSISGDETEKLQPKNMERNANSRDSLLMQARGHDSSFKSDSKMATGASILKTNNSIRNSSPLSSDEQESDSKEQSSKCTDNVRACSSKSSTASVISDSSSSSSLSRTNRFRLTHKPNSSATCAGSQHGMSLPSISGDETEKLQPKNMKRNANSRDSLLMQARGHNSSLKSDRKMATGASILKTNNVRMKTADVTTGRQQSSKFRTDLGRFVNRVTLEHTRCSPAKGVCDSNDRQRKVAMSDEQMALTSSQSDTTHAVLSLNSAPSDDPSSVNEVAKDVISDHQKPSAKSCGQEFVDNETRQNVLTSESLSSVDYETLKAAVRNLIRNSNDDLEKPTAEKVGQLVSSNNDTRLVNSSSNTSGQSLQEPAKNTNRSSNQEGCKLSSKGDCHKVSVSTSSSRVSEPDTSAVGSLADDSTDLNATSSSELGLRHHVACDAPSSSDVTDTPTESPSVNGVNCDNARCSSTSSDTTAGRADPTPNCAATCHEKLELYSKVCASNEGKRTIGADTCFDATSDAFASGFNEVERLVPRDTECRGLCQSVDKLPAMSRRLGTCRNIPDASVFTRQPISAFWHDEERKPRGFVSAGRYQKSSNVFGDASAEENTRRNPHEVCVHFDSSLGNDGCDEFSDGATADDAHSCDVNT